MNDTRPVFVASDVHHGAAPPHHQGAFLEWLEYAAVEASEIIINGDLFDFWYEYRGGITRGHEPLLSKLKEVVATGVPLTLVGGNHDWWGGRYLTEEIGVDFLWEPVTRSIAGRMTFLAHGDGLGAGDQGYRVMKSVLRSPVTTTAFGLLPVALGDRIASHVSNTEERWDQWGPRQQERSRALEAFAETKLVDEGELEVVLLGHTHLPLVREVKGGKWYVNSGDWVYHQSYVVLAAGEAPRVLDWRERT